MKLSKLITSPSFIKIEQKCGLFTNGQFFNVSNFFEPDFILIKELDSQLTVCFNNLKYPFEKEAFSILIFCQLLREKGRKKI